MGEKLGVNIAETITRSAIAKCLDFNMEANNIGDNGNGICSFFLMGNSRAICEELVYSAFFQKIGNTQSQNIALGVLKIQQLKSILAQTRFFATNNPMQPTVGGFQPIEEQKKNIRNAEIHLKSLWARQGFGRHPDMKSLSRKIGLQTTYDYVYHMSSNFVHFNPNQLLRLGWGSKKDGPFTFSVKHFEQYYSGVSRFLGAILFLGYCYAFPDMFKEKFSEKYIESVTSVLESNVRWPEIITFEEMNQKFPNILIQALMSVMRSDDSDELPNILSELKSLRNLG